MRRHMAGMIFGAVVIASVAGLSYAYHASYERELKKSVSQSRLQQKEKDSREIQEKNPAKSEALPAKGSATKEEVRFCLRNLNGYIAVYRLGEKGVYEYTNISILSLPAKLQKEIEEGGLILQGQKSLYGFLENYSS